MKMKTTYQYKVADLIHRVLSTVLQRETRDPRLSGVTITDVEVSQDLQFADIYYTHLGDLSETEEVQKALERAAGFLRTELAHRTRLRRTPQLRFKFDDTLIRARRIDQLLDQIARERAEREAAQQSASPQASTNPTPEGKEHQENDE